MQNDNPARPFYEHSQRNPEALAAIADAEEVTYGQLALRAQQMAAWLHDNLKRKPERVGILANRSIDSLAAMLGVCWAGGTYVPISLKLPPERLRAVMELAQLDAIITDAYGAPLLATGMDTCPLLQLDARDLQTSSLTVPDSLRMPWQRAPEDLAYIIFTSGSTGAPKGVMISCASLRHHAAMKKELYQLVVDDRIAQTADISFDLSVGEIFMTWEAGASLHVVPAGQSLAPRGFIQKHALTVWYSVPSVISLMRQMRALAPDIFPSLRWSLFIGEPLPVSAAKVWAEAAPNSIVENLYGPTEATVSCTRFRFSGSTLSPGLETVPIGTAMPGTRVAVLNEQLERVPAGTKGELALSGIQLAQGYYKDEARTQDRFPVMGGERWYLTGDAARLDEQGELHHCGRMDNQVKVLGYRVELEDIEAHLRSASGCAFVAAMAWPMLDGNAAGIVAFVTEEAANAESIKATLRERLPSYMVPNVIHTLPAIPLTPNGKIDRKQLLAFLCKGL